MKPIQGSAIRILSVLCALLLFVPGSWARTKSKHAAQHTAPASSKASKASVKRSSHTSSKSSSHSKSKSSRAAKGKKGKVVAKSRGQMGIDAERTREIQEALIRANYLQGEPSGVWDADTKAAMTKFQSDNGWQTKILPDSRALIKLGLGPSNAGLLNPDSAAVSSPHELGAEKEIPGGSIPHK